MIFRSKGVTVVKTPEALSYERIYAEDDTVMWDEAVGFTYCGTLEAASDGDRVTGWANLGHLPELSSFVLTRECELITGDDARYRDECPDWQRINQ